MITAKIEKTIKKYNMIKAGETVAVGVSGGADSMLLLSYLVSNSEKLGITVIAANVEHGIRGESSVNDSEFVRAWCKNNGVEFRGVSINAPKEAEEMKIGVEEYSRKRRYEFFASLGTDKIATAHNLSDNVETVLFRLVRGSSVKGICGIPPVRDNIIRPLIECSGDEIREYCNNNGIAYVVDETNSDNAYSRNYIRNEVIPGLKRLNPALDAAVSRCISSANEVDELLENEAKSFDFPLDINELKAAYPAVAKRAVQNYAQTFNVTLDEIHLNEAFSLVYKKGRIQLKGNLFAVSNGETLEIRTLKFNDCKCSFNLESKTVTKNHFLKNCELLKKEFAFYCDCDKIVGNIAVRSREAGDEITLAKRGVTKSLKKLFNELKIPEEKRFCVPIIADSEGVIGIYGYSISERVAPDSETENYCLLKISVEDNF